MKPTKAPFTKAEVDYLVKEAKCIRAVPRTIDAPTYIRIQAPVFYNHDRANPIRGLWVMATSGKPISGMSGKNLISAALEWNGIRIRGIDREQRHDNPDGSPTVFGWHEHIWSPEYEADVVVSCPEPQHKHVQALLEYGLLRWNIAVLVSQMKLEG